MYSRIIRELESAWPGFNKKSLDPDDVLKTIEAYGIKAIPDSNQDTATSLVTKTGGRFVLYNPGVPCGEQTLALGHEFGHFILGDFLAVKSKIKSLFKVEHGANIIGHLCLIPTRTIDIIHKHSRKLNVNALLWHLSPLGLLPENELVICQTRLDIYEDYLRGRALQ